MKKLKALVAGCLAAALLVGCGGGGDTASSNVFVMAKENDVSTLDLKLASTGMDFEVLNAYCEGLVALDKDSKVIPALAESYTISDDQTVYTFKLRDAKWTNGDPVTANDFVYSWQRTITDGEDYKYFFTDDMACIKNGNEVYAGEMDVSELGIKAVDDKTLEITLSKPTPYFLSLMAFPTAFPLNQKFVEEKGKDFATSADTVLACGPYVLTNYVKGSTVEFKKNDTYWDAENVHLDGMKMNVVSDASTASMDFESGNCDFTKINSSLVDKYKDDERYSSYLEGYLWFLQFNIANNKTDTPLANANIRKAISLSIDREDLCNNVLKDGSISARGFVPAKFAFGPDEKDYAETADNLISNDAAEAKKYWEAGLKELGVTSLELNLLHETSDPAKPAAEFIQGQLEKNLPGLKVTMTGVEKKVRTTKQQDGDFDITLTRWGPDYADPTTYLTLLTTGHFFNYGNWSNSEYDAKMKEVGSSTDVNARWQTCKDAEKLLLADGNAPIAPLFQTGGASLISKQITGLESHTFGTPYIYKNVVKK